MQKRRERGQRGRRRERGAKGGGKGRRELRGDDFEGLAVDATEGDGDATELHHQLAVAMDANDKALMTGKGSCEQTQFHAIIGKLLEGITKERNLIGVGRHQIHERLHLRLRNGGRTIGSTVFNQIDHREIIHEEPFKFSSFALKKD